jgi:hypothetical protein
VYNLTPRKMFSICGRKTGVGVLLTIDRR